MSCAIFFKRREGTATDLQRASAHRRHSIPAAELPVRFFFAEAILEMERRRDWGRPIGGHPIHRVPIIRNQKIRLDAA